MMLSMNVPAAPQINSSTENPVAVTNSQPKPVSGEKQKPATEKFAQVLEREVTETPPKQKNSGPPVKPEQTRESAGISTADESNAMLNPPTAAPIVNPLLRDMALEGAGGDKVEPVFLPMTVMPTLGTTMPAAETAEPGSEIFNLLFAPSPLTSLPASPLPSANGLLHSAESKPGATAFSFASQMSLQKPAPMKSMATDVTYFMNDFGQFMDMAESADSGKLLPFSSELSETILVNSPNNDESIFSATAESAPNSSLGLVNAASSAVQTLPAQSVQVDQPVGQPKWGGEFVQKIVWLTSQQHQVAEIHLNPAHLGPVEVMLSISQDQATAQFVSPHLAVREAIEQALPRLREMMAENGIQLGNVMVGAESFQQDNKQQGFFFAQAPSESKLSSATLNPLSEMETTVVSSRHHGIVNTFA